MTILKTSQIVISFSHFPSHAKSTPCNMEVAEGNALASRFKIRRFWHFSSHANSTSWERFRERLLACAIPPKIRWILPAHRSLLSRLRPQTRIFGDNSNLSLEYCVWLLYGRLSRESTSWSQEVTPCVCRMQASKVVILVNWSAVQMCSWLSSLRHVCPLSFSSAVFAFLLLASLRIMRKQRDV